MRFVLFNFVDPEDATAYYALSPEEQQADVERHFEWFRTHRDHIVGGTAKDDLVVHGKDSHFGLAHPPSVPGGPCHRAWAPAMGLAGVSAGVCTPTGAPRRS